ncbi:hypothetical protein M758_11G044500 [Ceratodon purpureus]|nr:hypothetical protein M758_11G044500 [Ceratodon purpureus]
MHGSQHDVQYVRIGARLQQTGKRGGWGVESEARDKGTVDAHLLIPTSHFISLTILGIPPAAKVLWA